MNPVLKCYPLVALPFWSQQGCLLLCLGFLKQHILWFLASVWSCRKEPLCWLWERHMFICRWKWRFLLSKAMVLYKLFNFVLCSTVWMLKQKHVDGAEEKGQEGNACPWITFINVRMFKLLLEACIAVAACCLTHGHTSTGTALNAASCSTVCHWPNRICLSNLDCTFWPFSSATKYRQLLHELYPQLFISAVKEGEMGLACPSPLFPAPFIVWNCLISAEIQIRRNKINYRSRILLPVLPKSNVWYSAISWMTAFSFFTGVSVGWDTHAVLRSRRGGFPRWWEWHKQSAYTTWSCLYNQWY